MPTRIDVRAIVTNINWNVVSASQSLPDVAITVVAMRAIIAIGISWGVLIFTG